MSCRLDFGGFRGIVGRLRELAVFLEGEMSTNIKWYPHIDQVAHILAKPLKYAFQYEYGDSFDIILSESSLQYLRTLSYAKIEGADKLIKAIKRYGKIRVWEGE